LSNKPANRLFLCSVRRKSRYFSRTGIIPLPYCIWFATKLDSAYSAIYVITKPNILSFTESIRYEYRNIGIRILVDCPNATKAHFFDNFSLATQKMRAPKDVVSTTFKVLQEERKLSAVIGHPTDYSSQCHNCFHRRRLCGLRRRVGKGYGKSTKKYFHQKKT